jgi:hypothetical protein
MTDTLINAARRIDPGIGIAPKLCRAAWVSDA